MPYQVGRRVDGQGTPSVFRPDADATIAARFAAVGAARRAFDFLLDQGTDAAHERAAELLELRARLMSRLA